MNNKEMQTFRQLFREYCRQEINKGHCSADSCDFCSVDHAYDKIFNHVADDEDSEAADDDQT